MSDIVWAFLIGVVQGVAITIVVFKQRGWIGR